MLQSSILGPLLFILFIYDIGTYVNDNCLLYDDNMKLFCNADNDEDCMLLQRNLNDVDK